MTYAEDCQYVEKSYLSHFLMPIQIKNLLHSLIFYSDTVVQPQIVSVCNLEFEENDNNQIVTSSPVPFF